MPDDKEIWSKFGTLEAEVRATREAVQELKQLLSDANKLYVPRNEVYSMLNTRDEQIKALQKDLSELKSDHGADIKELKDDKKWVWRSLAAGAITLLLQIFMFFLTKK